MSEADLTLQTISVGTDSTTGGVPPDDSTPPQPGDRCPDPPAGNRYQLLNEIGQGGMGVVYRARQLEPVERIVAIKVIKMGMDTRRFVQRFLAERQVMSRLDHPGIARVIDAGNTVLGRPYYAMEFVAGSPIVRFADREQFTLRERLALFLKVCQAIAHAHAKAIVHRDIKPSNVLAYRDDLGAMAIKVIDFGVAKAIFGEQVGGETLHTETGHAVGTHHYMSPEQADGCRDVDVRADIYSLGVVLYELLTGTRPFDEGTAGRPSSAEQRRRLARESEPQSPSERIGTRSGSSSDIYLARRSDVHRLKAELRNELEWIPLKAMRKDRERRYQTVEQLAHDVTNYLEGRPLLVGRERRGYIARKWLKRHRYAVAAASASVITLAATTAYSTHVAVRATRDRDELQTAIARVRDAEASVEQRVAAERTRADDAERRASADKQAAERLSALNAELQERTRVALKEAQGRAATLSESLMASAAELTKARADAAKRKAISRAR